MKHYIRVGRKFVGLPSAVGLYYNACKKEFSTTCPPATEALGICVDESQDFYTICSIKNSRLMSYEEAVDYAKASGGYIPNVAELLKAIENPDLHPMLFKSWQYQNRLIWASANRGNINGVNKRIVDSYEGEIYNPQTNDCLLSYIPRAFRAFYKIRKEDMYANI